jgi:hypothetical protein
MRFIAAKGDENEVPSDEKMELKKVFRSKEN